MYYADTYLYPDNISTSRINAKWKVEGPQCCLSWMLVPRCRCDFLCNTLAWRKFLARRRDRHASRDEAREPCIKYTADSEINPFYLENEAHDFHIHARCRAEKYIRRFGAARKSRRQTARTEKERKKARKDGKKMKEKREKKRMVNLGVTKIMKISRQDGRRRSKCGEEAKAIRIFRNYWAGLN